MAKALPSVCTISLTATTVLPLRVVAASLTHTSGTPGSITGHFGSARMRQVNVGFDLHTVCSRA